MFIEKKIKSVEPIKIEKIDSRTEAPLYNSDLTINQEVMGTTETREYRGFH